jgi:cytochrome c553
VVASALAFLLAAIAVKFEPAAARSETLQEKIAQCVACHGEAGLSDNPDVPHIGGQPKLFVMYQLFFYREGRRASLEMNTAAKGMSDADLTALSEFVAKLPPPPSAEGGVDQARYARGADLAAKRICASCHEPDYSGREQMPRLAGQRETYLLKSLQEYKAGKRVGTQAAMAEAVRGLDEPQLSDLAHYLAHFRK